MRKILVVAVALISVSLIACQNEESESVSSACDRQCLEGFVNQYLAAMVAGDASQAPFSEDVKYTENAKTLSLISPDEGLWTNAKSLNDYKFYIADLQSQQVAFVGFVEEEGAAVDATPALLSMRLKIENKEITEVESAVIRSVRAANIWALTTPPVEFSTALPPEEKVSREELIKVSNLYFDGIEQLNGSIVPWHEECYRLENGMWTAGPVLPEEIEAHRPNSVNTGPQPGGSMGVFDKQECAVGFNGGGLAVIENITPRRTPVVDVERGVTWGVYMFNHQGVETITMPDGSTADAPYFAGMPNSMPMSELFKIKGGKIRDVLALGVVNEYMSGSGWD